MNPTSEQQAIIEATAQSPASLMIQADAGTGKSSTLKMAAPGIRVPALFLAFNKKVITDITGQLPQHFTPKTANSLGHAAWGRAIRKNLKLDDKKVSKLIRQYADSQKIRLSLPKWTWLQQALRTVQQAGIPDSQEITPNDLDQLIIPELEQEFVINATQSILKESNNLSLQGTITFDDQIYCPTVLGGDWIPYPVIFVDERQDLSPLNHRMIALSLHPNGRIISAGDDKQAIYAFRGADSKSTESMRKLIPNWTDLPLHTTFRCPKVIVARQQHHAPDFTAWDGCLDGKFFSTPKENPHWNYTLLQNELSLMEDQFNSTLNRLPESIAVLCRNNGPLISLAFKLLRQNVGCYMLGRDIGRGLIAISTRLNESDTTPIRLHLSSINEWAYREISAAQTAQKESKVDRIEDQLESLLAVAEGSQARTAGELRLALSKLFSRDSGQITLSTIHRAKGLEFDLVVHLDPWRCPSKRAKNNPIQWEQEQNLRYVAETRTRHTLLNLNLKDFI